MSPARARDVHGRFARRCPTPSSTAPRSGSRFGAPRAGLGRRPRAFAGAVCLVLAMGLGLSATAGTAVAGGCGGTGAVPGGASPSALQAATLCLINDVRTAHHLRVLSYDNHLGAAAQGWADHLIGHLVLSHFGAGGGPPQRMDHAGYRCRGGCTQGENIAWAPQRATPAKIVRLWMHSAEHRANILLPRYAVAGIGVAARGRSGAMYVLDLASRGR